MPGKAFGVMPSLAGGVCRPWGGAVLSGARGVLSLARGAILSKGVLSLAAGCLLTRGVVLSRGCCP